MTGRRQRGLTVLELMLALALLALVAATLTTAIATGARVWERAQRLEAADDRILLRAELRRWIEAAKPPHRPYGLEQAVVATPAEFRFLGTTPLMSFPAETETRVSVLLHGAPDAPDLTIRLDALDSDGTVVASEERMLAIGLTGARLRYYGRPAPDRPGAWTDAWTDRRRLPELIAIEADVAPTLWPPFTVAPKLR